MTSVANSTCFLSSSPLAAPAPSLRWNVFANEPPSPTYQDGELSPSFDNSFASSMSFSDEASPVRQQSPSISISTVSKSKNGSSPHLMDISPEVPLSKASTSRIPPSSEFSFVPSQQQQQQQQRPRSSTNGGGLVRSRSEFLEVPKATKPKPRTLGRSSSNVDRLFGAERDVNVRAADEVQGRTKSEGGLGNLFKEMIAKGEAGKTASRPSPSPLGNPSLPTSRSRPELPQAWLPRSHHSMPQITVAQKAATIPLTRQRRSEPNVPTFRSLSSRPSVPILHEESTGAESDGMDIDPKSPPFAATSQNNGGLGLPTIEGSPDFKDLFNDDLSPEPAAAAAATAAIGGVGVQAFSRKRFLADDGPPSSPLACANLRPPLSRGFERSVSAASGLSLAASRRKPSNGQLRRPSLASFANEFGPRSGSEEATATAGMTISRDANGRPPLKARRAHSVSEAGGMWGAPPSRTMSLGTSQDGSPCTKPVVVPRPNTFSTSSSFPASLPAPDPQGFEQSLEMANTPVGGEADGKLLPCFTVKSDPLMRIKPSTLNDLLAGHYDALISDFMVVDCRFEYEFKGGHVRDAINLQSGEIAIDRLFRDELPLPSTSGEPDVCGNRKKSIIIFHCEFSAARAPSVAKKVREHDRKLNAAHYPRICYPEMYILEGGYAEYYKNFSTSCDPEAYVRMDDPNHLYQRAVDIGEFRRQKNFARARSFTYGEAQLASSVLNRHQDQNDITEDEHEGDSSFQSGHGSSPGGGDSPCPGMAKVLARQSMPVPTSKPKGGSFGRGQFSRAATTNQLSFA